MVQRSGGEAAGEDPQARRSSIPDRVLGAAGVAMIASALWLLLFGGPAEVATESGLGPPVLQLLSPAPADTVAAPLSILFTSSRPLSPQPGGWGADGFHLHAEIDGREAMPGPRDIRRHEADRYEWLLPGLPPGTAEIRLVWSDARHVPVEANSTEAIPVLLR